MPRAVLDLSFNRLNLKNILKVWYIAVSGGRAVAFDCWFANSSALDSLVGIECQDTLKYVGGGFDNSLF